MKVAEVPFWNTEEIAGRLAEMGNRITEDYAGKRVTVIGMLQGSFIFMADLVRHIRRPVECSFIDRIVSNRSSKVTELMFASRAEVEGADVLLVQDVLDTGVVLAYVRQQIEERGARSIRVAALLVLLHLSAYSEACFCPLTIRKRLRPIHRCESSVRATAPDLPADVLACR